MSLEELIEHSKQLRKQIERRTLSLIETYAQFQNLADRQGEILAQIHRIGKKCEDGK